MIGHRDPYEGTSMLDGFVVVGHPQHINLAGDECEVITGLLQFSVQHQGEKYTLTAVRTMIHTLGNRPIQTITTTIGARIGSILVVSSKTSKQSESPRRTTI